VRRGQPAASPSERNPFEAAKVKAQQELGEAYAAAHDAAMAAPLEQALRDGDVLAATP
jgi:hypothetical protein